MSKLRRIPLYQLKAGMVVVRCDKAGIPFPYYGRPLEDVRAIKVLEEYGVEQVFIKVAEESDDAAAPKRSEPQSTPGRAKPDDEPKSATGRGRRPTRTETARDLVKEFNERAGVKPKPGKAKVSEPEKEKAEAAVEEKTEEKPKKKRVNPEVQFHQRATEETKDIIHGIRMGKTLDVEHGRDIVNNLVTECMTNPDVFLTLARIKDFEDYNYAHSVNVAILSIAVAQKLEWGIKEMHMIGLAGLLHDVGKMRVPERILTKNGPLNEIETAVMQKHPMWGYEILKKDQSIPYEARVAVLQHHEKSDGTGYPYGVMEKHISKFSKVIAICDVYDAMTSDRIYQTGTTPSMALKMIFQWSGKHFNDVLSHVFIKSLGIYPVGALVMLDGQELAVVVEVRRDDILRPKVLVVGDASGARVDPYEIDLQEKVNGDYAKRITLTANPKKFAINTNEIINNYSMMSRY